MAKFKTDTSGLDKLMKKLSNYSDSAKDAEGNMSIDLEEILKNQEEFNKAIESNLPATATPEQIKDYFVDAYISLTAQYLTSDESAKDIFNDLFNPYARIE